ncbi:MAG: hypothetical protein IPL50_07640 [Chitinophagaceae bacterium]|nr:hypothetical protein [Chitinophagaceae bacterium]
MQECIGSVCQSIQSFDSKYDAGRQQVANDGQPFPNFTPMENMGKQVFLTPPVFNATGIRVNGGAGCNGCHNAPEFDIDPNSRNNGIIGTIAATGIDITVTRAPSLRDVTNPAGFPNGPFMHREFKNPAKCDRSLRYHQSCPGNTNLDPRLRPNGFGQQLNFTQQEVDGLMAF